MAKRCKVEKAPVFLDFDSHINKLKGEGIKKQFKEISKDVGFSVMTINAWREEAPEVVTMIYHYLKENDLTFEEFVKLCPK